MTKDWREFERAQKEEMNFGYLVGIYRMRV